MILKMSLSFVKYILGLKQRIEKECNAELKPDNY